MDFNGVALSKSFQVRQAFCCKTYALGCPTHDPAVEEPVREEVHVVDVPPAPAPVTVVHHVHHYTTVSEPVEVEPAAAPYDCDAGQGSSEGSSQVCLDFLRVLQEWVPKKITLATWSSHGNSAIHYLFAEGPINSLKMQRTVRGVTSCPCAGMSCALISRIRRFGGVDVVPFGFINFTWPSPFPALLFFSMVFTRWLSDRAN